MYSPENYDKFLSTLDSSIGEMLDEGWADKNPPTSWGHCLLCQVKGDMVNMFFCFNCGIVFHPNCMDKDTDPMNDACLTK